jgi:hypothetical protein
LFVILLIGLDIFYFSNRRLYALLEKDDWPALVQFLEGRVITRNKYSQRLVRLLANSYLVLSDPASVLELEDKLSVAKPCLIETNCLVFGIARILGRDNAGAAEFFKRRLDADTAGDWIRFYHAFASLGGGDFEAAANDCVVLAGESRIALIIGLSGYFLAGPLKKGLRARAAECIRSAKIALERVKKSLHEQKDWNRELSRSLGEIHVAIISKYLDKAGQWIYK